MNFSGFLRRRTAVLALALSAVAVAPSAAQTSDDAVRQAVASGSSARVIMQFATAAARDAAFTRLLDRGAAVRATDTEVGPALVVFGSAAALAAEFASASQVSTDAPVTVASVTPARARAARRSSQAGTTHDTPSFGGLSVAVIDSGFQPHPDLPLSRIRKFMDFVSGATTPVDQCGHGTHVAGIIAGSGALSAGAYAGVAPGVDIVALRVLGNDCSGTTSDVIDALEWVARNHETYKIKVVNMSLGHGVLESIFTDPLVQAVERLSRKGIAVVTAAGNKGINPATGNPGYGGVGVPCNAPSAICVGSLDTQDTENLADDRVADTSSRGPTRFDLLAKPDLVARGVDVVSLAAPGSALFRDYPDLRVNGVDGQPHYFTLSGTSMSSPAVAGAAALLFKTNNQLSANAVKLSLQFTARILPLTDVLTQGAGALNLVGAMTLAKAINPAAPRGTNWIKYAIAAQNRDEHGLTIKWGQRIIYGDRFMRARYAQYHLFRWDDDIVWAYDAIADNIVWGNQQDDNIVWGNDDNIVWGNDDNIVWGNSDDDNIVWGNGIARGVWAANVVWGFWDDNIVWGNVAYDDADNIVWGNDDDNIVWGNCSQAMDDNIVWGNCDNIVWGNDDNIVWGNSVLTGGRR